MAFPTSPINGQQVTVNGVTYTYSSALTAWTVTSSGGSLTTASALSVTGNVTGGNLTTAGQVVATGNVNGGNLVTLGTTTTGSLTASTTISATGNVTGGNLNTAGQVIATGNVSGGNLNTAGQVIATGNVSGGNIIGFLVSSAGTTASPALQLTTGNLLTSPIAGAIEFNSDALFGTENTTSGRGEISINNQFRYTSPGSNLGSAIADYFPANSSISLEAGSYYELDCMAFFLKNTNGTVTWTWTNSSAVEMIRSYYVGTAAAGFNTTIVTTAPVVGLAVQRTSTALAHAATGSLTTAVYHHYHFKVHVITTLATNIRLRVTNGAGTVTPQAGSYYSIRKISANAGTFAV